MLEQNEELKVRRRNRPSLVCNACRQRKIKCNKGRPCSGCVKNKIEHLCKYDYNWPIKKKQRTSSTTGYTNSARYPIAVLPSNGTAGENDSGSIKTSPKGVDASENSVLLIEKSKLDELNAKLQKYEASSNEAKAPTAVTETIVLSDDGIIQNTAINQHIEECPMTGTVLHNPDLPGEVNNCCFCTLFIQNENYTEEPIKTDLTNSDKLYKPKSVYIGVNPYQDEDETINLFDDSGFVDIREPSSNSNGIFNWSSVWKKDKPLVLLKKYSQYEKFESGKGGTLVMSKSKGKNVATTIDSSLPMSANVPNRHKVQNSVTERSANPTNEIMTGEISSDSSQQFARKDFERSNYMPYKNSAIKGPYVGPRRRSLNNSPLPLGISLFDSQVDRELKLVEQIKHTIPKKRVIWLLVKRFFRFLYPFFPFLDEVDFRREISRIIGPESYEDEKLKEIYVEKRIDLANLGILLVVLRLTYLSLFSNRCSVNNAKLTTKDSSPAAQEAKYLLSNPVHINAINTGQVCLHQFQFSRKYSLPVLQCALFVRLYHKYAPEDGDGVDGGDSQASVSVLIQMAYSMGLNREPDNFKDCLNNERLNNVGRKIWHSLLINDFINAYTYGSPLTSAGMFYDTKVPFYRKGNENVLNHNLDKAIAKCHGFAGSLIYGPMKDIVRLTSSLRKDIKMSELTKYLNRLEICPNKLFGEPSDYTNVLESEGVSYSFVKMTKLGVLLSLKGFYLSVYSYLISHYDAKKNNSLSFYYRKKISSCIAELTPSLFLHVCKGQEIFGEGADLLINPHLERIIHIINEINLSMLVRANYTLHRMVRDPDHRMKLNSDVNYKIRFQKLGRYIVLLENCARVCILGTSIMSQRYYYAWGLNRSHSFLLRIIKNEEFYLQNMNCDIGVENIATHQLQELIDITEGSFAKLNSIISAHCEDYQVQRLFDLKNQPQMPSILINTSATNSPSSSLGIIDDLIDYDTTHVPEPFTEPSAPMMATSDFDGFNFGTSAEIDALWLQMLSMKNQKRNFIHNQDSPSSSTGLSNADKRATDLYGSLGREQGTNQAQEQGDSYNQYPRPYQGQYQTSGRNFRDQPQNQQQNQSPSNNYHFEGPNIQTDNLLNQPFDFGNTDDLDMFSDLPLDQLFSGNIV
jgi:hypothetical protein